MPAWFMAHPWMTLFLGFAAIDGVVTLVRGYNPVMVNALGNQPAAPAPAPSTTPTTTSGALPWGYMYALPALGAKALAAKAPSATRGGVTHRGPTARSSPAPWKTGPAQWKIGVGPQASRAAAWPAPLLG